MALCELMSIRQHAIVRKDEPSQWVLSGCGVTSCIHGIRTSGPMRFIMGHQNVHRSPCNIACIQKFTLAYENQNKDKNDTVTTENQMPVYEYKCPHCDDRVEVLQKHSDPEPVCRRCGSKPKMDKQVSLTSFRLVGSGWAADGYGR